MATDLRRVLAGIAVLYAAVRLGTFLGVEPTRERDTLSYELTAHKPLLSKSFLAGGRAWTVPLLYKVLSGPDARIWAQLVLSIGSWLTLAAAVAEPLRGRYLKVIAFAAVLLFSLSEQILRWDPWLISESVATSLLALVAAGCLFVIHRPTWPRAALLSAALVPWVFSRDPHAWLLLMAVPPLLVWVALPGRRWPRALVLAGVCALAAAGLWSTSVGNRWQLPLEEVIAVRIAPNPEALLYFHEHGMPVDRRFLLLSARYRLTGDNPFPFPSPVQPLLMPWQRWFQRHGRSTYLRYLLSHPHELLKPLDHTRDILFDPDVDSYDAAGSPRPVPAVADTLYPRGTTWPVVYLAIAVLLAAAAAWRVGVRREWIVPLFMLATALPFAMLIWIADTASIGRHAIPASQLLRLGTLVLAFFALDSLLAQRRSRSSRA
jgi:hypothetical protein